MGGSIRQRRWFPFWNHHASHGEEEIKEGKHKVIPECCQGWLVGTGRVASTGLGNGDLPPRSSGPSLMDGLLTKG